MKRFMEVVVLSVLVYILSHLVVGLVDMPITWSSDVIAQASDMFLVMLVAVYLVAFIIKEFVIGEVK